MPVRQEHVIAHCTQQDGSVCSLSGFSRALNRFLYG